MTGRDDNAWHDDNCSYCSYWGCDCNMLRFSVIKTTKRDRAMMSTELDDSTWRLCVRVCVDTFIITIFILTRGVSCLFEQFEFTVTHSFKK